MSLCTLIENKNKILQYYDQINRITESHNSNWQTVSYILTDLIKTQWDLRRKYYNKNMLEKHKFEISVKGKEYLNCLFQHIYNHGHSALTDEIFEVKEVLDKIQPIILGDHNQEDYYNLITLHIEELIDCLFFIIEQTSWLETHFQLMLVEDGVINSSNISYYLNNYNMFSDRINIMINEEGSHITQYIYDHKNKIKKEARRFSIYDLLELNREFLRTTAWKDWKKYNIDYYSPFIFGELFKLNRKMYVVVLNMLYIILNFYADNILEIKDYDQQNHISEMFKLIYAIFKTKADENEYRQLNDKRYNPENTGETHGVNV